MKFLAQVIVILVVSYVVVLFLPWYSVAFVAFVFGYALRSKASFLAGFIAIGLLWFIKIWMVTSTASSDLVERVARLFPVQEPRLLILLTVMIGALVGGFAAMTGSLLKPRKRRAYY